MPNLRYTSKVRLAGIQPAAVVILQAIDNAIDGLTSECFVTSITNGNHSRGSLHYIGHAVDFDIVPEPSKEIINQIEYDLKHYLTVEYDVVPEYHGDGSFSHFHVEFQPKSNRN